MDYLFKHDFQFALCHLQRALDIETALHGKDANTNISKRLGHIALVHQFCGDNELALKYFQDALSIEQRLLPPHHFYIGLRLENLAACHMHRAEYQLALQYYQQALVIVERTLPVHHKHYSIALHGIIDSLDHLGDYEQAIEFAFSKLDIDQTLYKGWIIVHLSELHLKINDLNKAYQYFQDASIFYEKNQSKKSSALPKIKKKLKELEQSFSTITNNQSSF